MKTTPLAIITIISSFIFLPSVLGQGSLTPPGPPGPAMLSLSQIEPRTPISSAPYIITKSGSYYLTTNLTVSSGNAITIATNGVTLDLNGFTISSTAAGATGYGILLSNGPQNLTIANGHIQGGVTNNGSGVYSGGGFANGIEYSDAYPANVLVSRVSVSGCLNDGINLGNGVSTVAENCTVQTAGGSGIVASTVKASTALDCGLNGIDSYDASDCRGQSSGSGYGVAAGAAENCYGNSGSGYGIYAFRTALNCYGNSIGVANGTGVYAEIAENCLGLSNGSGYGVYADTTTLNCFGGCGGNGIGLYAGFSASGCYGNSFSGTGLTSKIAIGCYGSGTVGISASIANSCYSTSGDASIINKYNMP
jgi:hypothetical protein